MKIQILGTGCPKCEKLTEMVEEAIRAEGLDARLEKVTDIEEILTYGILMTPGLVIDGELKMTGKLPTPEQLRELLAQPRGE